MRRSVLSSAALLLMAAKLVNGTSQGFNSSIDDSVGQFLFWTDYPGSSEYAKTNPQWYDPIVLATGTSFTTTGGATVNVNGFTDGQLHLWADYGFQQGLDDSVRKLNGPESSTQTGSIDKCGWPGATPNQATAQYTRQTKPFFDDFVNGLQPSSWKIPMGQQACCSNPITNNVNIAIDPELGKPVLELIAQNLDSPACKTGNDCHKYVSFSGSVISADLFASGTYTVRAKVPPASGTRWAIWIYHNEYHLPRDCSEYTCFCGSWGKQGCPKGECMPASYYIKDHCPAGSGCAFDNFCDMPGYAGSTAQQCGQIHSVDDPQFAGSASFAGYVQVNNHEIDIEIPANCENTPNVCKDGSCAGDYSTVNLNNYIMSNNGGIGQAYTNMCVKVAQPNGTPMMLMGDGNYHNYTIEWHTGTSSAGGSPTDAYVNSYIDGVYLGTNNAFVPTRAGRLWMALLPAGAGWNGYPDNWGGGTPGDGKSYTETVMVDFVSITPFNEANDLAYPASIDQPDGCDVYYTQYGCHFWEEVTIPVP